MALNELIEALKIFRKYGNPDYPTHCRHDELMICGINPEIVNEEDKEKLDEMGFFVNDYDGFSSYRYGSA